MPRNSPAETICVVKGNVIVSVNEQELRLSSPGMVVIPPSNSFGIKNNGRLGALILLRISNKNEYEGHSESGSSVPSLAR